MSGLPLTLHPVSSWPALRLFGASWWQRRGSSGTICCTLAGTRSIAWERAQAVLVTAALSRHVTRHLNRHVSRHVNRQIGHGLAQAFTVDNATY